jgi:hypothetical protein
MSMMPLGGVRRTDPTLVHLGAPKRAFWESHRADYRDSLRNRTNPTRRFETTKSKELRFLTILTEGASKVEAALV